MVNLHRGEIEAELGGRMRKLRLTLGALAELEAACGEEDLLSLITRFEQGRISATDCIAVLRAGLKGAGEEVDEAEVAGFGPQSIGVVVRLLEAAFGA
jgi:hypothetical protein